MDAVERARWEAAAIHRAAVAAGDNPDQPLAFVQAEAARREIVVYQVPPGDPQLKGGVACFDSQSRTILYEDCGTEFDRAFLIAHELGHAILEGGTDDGIAIEIEHDRSVEDAPVGIERVLDYGARERREVRMDLFAREFLLPRHVAIDLHVARGLTASSIASRLGARLPLVQQQLLDALLLPTVARVEETSVPTADPVRDDSQRDAVCHIDGPFLLQAGPGTGKTRTLVERVNKLLGDGVTPSSILVLTFSNKAASELIERISARHPAAAAEMWIGTFHSFGLDITRRFHEKLNLPPDARVVDRTEAIELLEDELPRLRLRHFRNLWDPTMDLSDMLTAISRAKDEVVDAAQYRALSEAMLRGAGEDEAARKNAEKCNEVAILFEAYERLMAAERAVDFGDLVANPVRLLESDATVRETLRQRHVYTLVDEYQDVNHASVRLLKNIAGDGRKLWVVGDARQSIYRFRGAAPTNIAQFTRDFPGATVRQLGVNYRSSREIVDTFTKFSGMMEASVGALPLKLHANRGELRRRPELRTATLPVDEISATAAAIQEQHEAGVAFHQQAVLCASNARLGAVAEGLEARGIPVLHLGSLFEREEVKDLLAMLSLLVDTHAGGLVRLASLGAFRLPLQDVFGILRYAAEHDIGPTEWRELPARIASLSPDTIGVLMRVSELLDGFSASSSPWSVLATWVIDRLGMARTIYEKGDLPHRMRGLALWQFLNFCRRQPARKGLPIRRLLDRIRRLILLSEDRGLHQLPGVASGIDAVRLLTIHAAKGLEFESVHLPGLVTTGLPRSYRAPRCIPPDGLIHAHPNKSGSEAVRLGHEEEEECLFFVALSRARDRLALYTYKQQDNGKARTPSPFLDAISSSFTHVSNPRLVKGSDSAPHFITVRWEKPPSWSESQLDQFDRCPRRFFYTHVLQVHGRRTDTPFLRMHHAVFDVLDWLKTNHPATNPTRVEVDAAFEDAWKRKGTLDHGYAADYRRIGRRLIEYLLEVRQARTLTKAEPIKLPLSGCEIVVTPDSVASGPGGKVIVRRTKTGKMPSSGLDELEFGILQLAAAHAYGEQAQVEVDFLTSEQSVSLELSAKKINTRKQRAQEIVGKISGGAYPAQEEARTCPRCPSFFVCSSTPQGELNIKN